LFVDYADLTFFLLLLCLCLSIYVKRDKEQQHTEVYKERLFYL